ncbi:hypothetical protein GBA63_18010 [Rubrobacter tropicus]|uniref:Plasmid maintenance system killer n=1 Tax=Rubrobacter tropicus TaxID=2653851 RepID=A0A6G8QDJ8_9ACTN|nr:type II toxin-antitoxin system RelE/ParE family toxin [Rubrobacter tropicus]QIN84327.1 hypothetical protein GBA63_18010 [Rubrobacter tropicus]
MIKSFADRDTERLFMGRKSRAIPEQARRRAQVKLAQLNRVESVEELARPPGNRLHKLSGDREGQWSVSINARYRICFLFEDGDAHDVEVTDYH